MTGRHEGEPALERPQARCRQIPHQRLAIVADAFFVNEEQMTWRAVPIFERIMRDCLNDVDPDSLPFHRAAADNIGRKNLQRLDLLPASLWFGQCPTIFLARTSLES